MDTKNAIVFLAILLIAQTIVLAEGRGERLAKKAVFSGNYPQFLVFRNNTKSVNRSFETWEKFHSTGQGSIKKYMDEELDIKPFAAEYATKFVEQHPDSLMLMHLNGGARNAIRRDYASKIFFPGHWIYLPGSTLAQDISPSDVTFKVNNTDVFNMQEYFDRPKKSRRGKKKDWPRVPPDMIMVHVGSDGKKIWRNSEYVKLAGVNKRTSTITVKRGQYFSTAIAHKSGKTYIAPLQAIKWSGWLWFYNLSSICPEDESGMTAADVFLKELKENFSPGGRLHAIDGIAFDLNRFYAYGNWDVDNDGKADGGIIKGRNVWRDGDLQFFSRLRKMMGDDFIITADGHKESSQRAVGILNGLESEGPVEPKDGYRGFSRMVNIHTYWDQYNTTPYEFRYIVLKFRNEADAKNQINLARLAMGSAACLGAATTNLLDNRSYRAPELVMGEADKSMWLGKPEGEMIRLARRSSDMLNGDGRKMPPDFFQAIKVKNCRITDNNDGELSISGIAENAMEKCTITLPPIDVPEGDVVVYLEVKSEDALVGLETTDRVPRLVRLRVDKLPDYERGKNNKYYGDLWGFAGTAGYSTLSFYYRRAGEKKLTFTIEVEEQGAFKLRNISVHNAPAALAREFENGVVLVNPAFDIIQFDLRELFPYKGEYRRIKAKADQIDEVRKYNDGSLVTNPYMVKVPPLNSLFLIKDENEM